MPEFQQMTSYSFIFAVLDRWQSTHAKSSMIHYHNILLTIWKVFRSERFESFTRTFSYREALKRSNVPSLYNRRQSLTDELFNKLVVDSNHKLHNLLPPLNHSLPLRNSLRFYPPICKTNRLKNTFIIKNSYKYIT